MRSLGLLLEGKSIKIALISNVKNHLKLELIKEFDDVPYERSVRRNPDPSGSGQDELSRVERKASLDAPHPQTDEESPPLQGGVLQLLQEKNLHIVTGLSSEDVVRREVTLKLTKQSAVLKALPFQLENLLPFSLEETIVHPFFYPRKDKTDATVFATTRLALKKHLTALQEKQIDPDQVSCIPMALARFVRLLFSETSIHWIYEKTALAMEGERIVFSQTLEDVSRLETYLKNKFGHSFSIPAELPSFQDYSPEQLHAFAIPIGLALEGLSKNSCQFRQNNFTAAKKTHREQSLKRGAWAALLSLTVLVGSLGVGFLHRQEKGLKERVAVHFSSSGSLEDQLSAWQKKLSQEGQDFPLFSDVPKVRDVLAWLGTLQEPIEIVHFHYNLVQYPKIDDTAKPYQAKIEIEFTAPSPAVAHRFQEALEKAPTLVDKKQKVTWTSQKESYKLSFVLRKI